MKSFPIKKSILSLIILSILSCSSVKTATVSGKFRLFKKGKMATPRQLKMLKEKFITELLVFLIWAIPNYSNKQKLEML